MRKNWCLLFLLGSLLSPWLPGQQAIRIDPYAAERVATIDERFQSYNVEMAEVIGGDFWIPYADMDTNQVGALGGGGTVGEDRNRYRYRPPVDLSNARLRRLAAALSPAFVRVSGSWANSNYFQNDDKSKRDKAPAGFKNVLTREEWRGVQAFVAAVDADLMVSLTISPGVRNEQGRWTPAQASEWIAFHESLGGTVEALQFFNEPNLPTYAGAPEGYSGTDFAEDVARFTDFADERLPGVPTAGPDAVGEGGLMPIGLPGMLGTPALLSAEPKPQFDVFAYHHYGGVSRRCATTAPMHSPIDSALTDTWLKKTLQTHRFYEEMRDTYLPDAPMWLVETAEAACGGNPWAAEYIDVFRYLTQMGELAKRDVQVIMHNTLTASDYGMLDESDHTPRSNYWAALLWRRLVGTEVYDTGIEGGRLGVYVHSRRDLPAGRTLLLINPTDAPITFELTEPGERYVLTSDDLRSKTLYLNGERLSLTQQDELPAIVGKPVTAGPAEVPAHGIAFYTFD